jgi:hypothetical protein
MTQDNFENVMPAHFVHGDDEDEYVRGFVSVRDVDRYEMEICTFDQIDLPAGGRSIRESMTMTECADLLSKAIQANPEMGQHWSDIINDA